MVRSRFEVLGFGRSRRQGPKSVIVGHHAKGFYLVFRQACAGVVRAGLVSVERSCRAECKAAVAFTVRTIQAHYVIPERVRVIIFESHLVSRLLDAVVVDLASECSRLSSNAERSSLLLFAVLLVCFTVAHTEFPGLSILCVCFISGTPKVPCALRGLEPYSYSVRNVNHSLSQESFDLPAPQRAMLRRSVVAMRESPNLQLVLGRNQYRVPVM